MFDEHYEDKLVIVTGAASGMGRCVTQYLVELKAKVLALDINSVNIPGASEEKVDFLREESIAKFVDQLGDRTVDAVFCCAGLPHTFSTNDIITVNFLATRHFLSLLLPKLKDTSAACVITSLTQGWVANAKRLAPLVNSRSILDGQKWVENNIENMGDPYVFSKEALAAWATITSTRWIQRGIRLNCLCPGVTQTPMLQSFYEATADTLNMLPQPLNRATTPEEQAFAMLFINHPRSSALVGASIFNDGGSSAALSAAYAAGLTPQ